MIPLEWKLIAGAVGALALLCLLAVGVAAIEKHGEAKATAVLQPKLDVANANVVTLRDANATNEAYIRALQANDQANDLLNDQLADRVTAFTQQAQDTGATIRKLQNDDATVAAFLSAPIPPALLRVLPWRASGPGLAADRGANPAGAGAAAKGKAL